MKQSSNVGTGALSGLLSRLKNGEKLPGNLSQYLEEGNVAKVTSSVKLTADEQKKLEKVLTGLTGSEVTLSCVVDPSVLGGLRVEVGDWVVDTTIASELEELAAKLKE